jgi:hypothetical protein
MPILVSVLIAQYHADHRPKPTYVFSPLSIFPKIMQAIIAVVSLIWKSGSHPFGAYLLYKLCAVIWVLVLSAVNDEICRGKKSVLNSECKITITAQARALHELHDSDFIALTAVIRLLLGSTRVEALYCLFSFIVSINHPDLLKSKSFRSSSFNQY